MQGTSAKAISFKQAQLYSCHCICWLVFRLSRISKCHNRTATAQALITGLSASTKSARLSHSLDSWRQQHTITVAHTHLNLNFRVFPGLIKCQKPNCKFNVDANSGHAFGILLAAAGALRPYGAPAPVNSFVRQQTHHRGLTKNDARNIHRRPNPFSNLS